MTIPEPGGNVALNDPELSYRSDNLPGGTLARSVFDQQLMRLSDRGGASRLIGERWSDVVADKLAGWIGAGIPTSRADLRIAFLTYLYRLDTIPGIAARASKLGLKNPDFLAHLQSETLSVVIGIDAKFSIETARHDQVSGDAIARLFNEDEILANILPSVKRAHTFARGLFVSPDYSLTRAMFRQRMGHRRMTVSQTDVVLVEASAVEMFGGTTDPEIMARLKRLDALPEGVVASLLASQYYFRLERAMRGMALDEQLPLLGTGNVVDDDSYVLEQVARRSRAVDSAWELMLRWDRDVEHIRRQRQALHQVMGIPVSGAELRELADVTLATLEPGVRPSRNQVRKALGSMFAREVSELAGVIPPTIVDFPAELERVASISREVADRYLAGIDEIVRGVVLKLAEGRLVEAIEPCRSEASD